MFFYTPVPWVLLVLSFNPGDTYAEEWVQVIPPSPHWPAGTPIANVGIHSVVTYAHANF